MNSCIYKGQVRHQRYTSSGHSFMYSMYMMYVDLDELPTLFDSYLLWGVDKYRPAAIFRKDHYGENDSSLAESIRALVYQETEFELKGPIRLLTHFRNFGYVFNPLSLYFCFDEKGEKVEKVVAEVMNTPWREQHCYVLSNNNDMSNVFSYSHAKQFHVSPFMNLDMQYRWSIQTPDNDLNVKIENWQQGKKIFDASVFMKKIEISRTSLNKVLFMFPLMTLKVISAIYLQAFKLWMKGNVYVPYPKHR